jgi:DNA primase
MSILEVVKSRLGEPTGSGEWACPFCARHGAVGALSVRAEPPTFYCPQCGHGGDAVKFVAMYDRISPTQAEEKLAGPQPAQPPQTYHAPDVVARPRFSTDMLRGKFRVDSRMEKASSS